MADLMHMSYDEYDYDRMMEDSDLPVCDECGGAIHDEYYYDINGLKICPDCIDHFKRYTD